MSELNQQTLNLQGYKIDVERRTKVWKEANFSRRLWEKDPTLWFSGSVPEITDRLGWLELPDTMSRELDDLTSFSNDIKEDGIRHVVLLGMGGSSLAPMVFQDIFGNPLGHPELIVLDSTHPAAISAVEKRIDMEHTLFLVSSKSGTTLETLSFFRYFWRKAGEVGGEPGRSFVAITDTGTPLEQLARERSFRRIFNAPPDLGGRYSALTVFGLVPAALIGMDICQLLEQAGAFCTSEQKNPGLVLGAVMGELAIKGRDKVTFFSSPSIEGFPTWLEQLIAESTGKDGKGIVPVVGEPLGAVEMYGDDRIFVYFSLEDEKSPEIDERLMELEAAGHPTVRINLSERAGIGQEIFRWELAVAAACTILGVNPFNQPDVELSKELARQAMKNDTPGVEDVETFSLKDPSQTLTELISQASQGDYACIQAYLAPKPEVDNGLTSIRKEIMKRYRIPTTVGYGPRFLHSTGQLHKGGPATGIFLQILDEIEGDVDVPDTDYTFGEMIQAQAIGDHNALKQRGRRVLRVQLSQGDLERMAQLIREG